MERQKDSEYNNGTTMVHYKVTLITTFPTPTTRPLPLFFSIKTSYLDPICIREAVYAIFAFKQEFLHPYSHKSKEPSHKIYSFLDCLRTRKQGKPEKTGLKTA